MTARVAVLLLLFVFGATGQKPNFIIIFCDNLGYGDIEPFGSKLHRTPHLNRMAAEGRRFTHFYVTSGVCTPSRASLLTGVYAQRLGLHRTPRGEGVLFPISSYGLHPDEITLAEVLKEQGYATAIVGKWHLGDQPPLLPTRQGFDSFFGIPYSDDMTQALGSGRFRGRYEGPTWPPLPLMRDETVIEAPPNRNLLTQRLTEAALKFLEDNKDRPFFLYFPEAMPGSEPVPFASEAFRGRSRNGLWGDSIEELDWSAGQVLDKVVDLGIEENTFVLWLSDNGSPLAENVTSLARGSNLPLHGRGYTTAEGGFRVPAIAWQPGTVAAGTVSDAFLSTLELLPTLANWAGAKLNDDRGLDGFDAGPVIRGEPGASSPRKTLYYYRGEELQAIRNGPWKLFLPLENPRRHPHFPDGEGSEPLLFNVVDDVGSKRNVAARHPEIVARLAALAEEARAELGDLGRPGTGLRPIGYVADPKPLVLSP